jgi:hypothetical protein
MVPVEAIAVAPQPLVAARILNLLICFSGRGVAYSVKYREFWTTLRVFCDTIHAEVYATVPCFFSGCDGYHGISGTWKGKDRGTQKQADDDAKKHKEKFPAHKPVVNYDPVDTPDPVDRDADNVK